MKRAWSLIATAMMFPACTGRKAPPESAPGASPPAYAEGAPAGQADEHDDVGRVVEVAREMLGDLRLTTATVESRPGGEGAPVLGELRVNEDAYAAVGTPVSARAVRILAAPGQRVKAGQVLAEMRSPDIDRARGEERQAQARVDLARRALERKRGLASERIAPLREVQEAEAELHGAEAALQAARGALGTMGAETGGSAGAVMLRTPVAGTVIDRHLVLGEMA
jgi:cobalt-zinc-cadmium efflux system membrane fusion protein